MEFSEYPFYIVSGNGVNSEDSIRVKIVYDSSIVIADEDFSAALKTLVNSLTGTSNATVSKKAVASSSL